MDDLDNSAKRLDAALLRLETAVGKRSVGVELGDEEQERLSGELAELRSDFERLKETSSDVSDRLASTIGRLKVMLEEES